MTGRRRRRAAAHTPCTEAAHSPCSTTPPWMQEPCPDRVKAKPAANLEELPRDCTANNLAPGCTRHSALFTDSMSAMTTTCLARGPVVRCAAGPSRGSSMQQRPLTGSRPATLQQLENSSGSLSRCARRTKGVARALAALGPERPGFASRRVHERHRTGLSPLRAPGVALNDRRRRRRRACHPRLQELWQIVCSCLRACPAAFFPPQAACA